MSESTEQKTIYREKSLERVSSPEKLNDYMSVVNAGVWVLLSAIIILIIGAFVWCAAIRLETKSVPVAAAVKNGTMTLYITKENKDVIQEGMKLRIAERTFILPETELDAVKLFAENDGAIMKIIGSDGADYVYVFRFETDMPNGVFSGKITTDEVSPITLLFN